MAANNNNPKRMDIWYAKLDRQYGSSIQGGTRPVLVVSNDLNNEHSSTVVVLPMTGKYKKNYLPTHVWLESADVGGELFDSMVLAEQVTTIDKYRLISRVGRLEDDVLIKQVEQAMTVQLGMKF